jgi:predicted CoA-binding protein
MARLPSSVAEFLAGKRLAVGGVSRQPQQAANAIYRKLCNSGFDVLPVNPNAAEAEGVRCYPNLASIPGTIDGVVVAPSAPVLPVQLWHCPTENRLRALRCQG